MPIGWEVDANDAKKRESNFLGLNGQMSPSRFFSNEHRSLFLFDAIRRAIASSRLSKNHGARRPWHVAPLQKRLGKPLVSAMSVALLKRKMARGELMIPPKSSTMPTAQERLKMWGVKPKRRCVRAELADSDAAAAPLQLDSAKVSDVASILKRMRAEACKIVFTVKRKNRKKRKAKASAKEANAVVAAGSLSTSTALAIADEDDEDDEDDENDEDDEDNAGNAACQGAYVGCMAVMAELVTAPPKGTLSVRAHGCQYELVLRAMGPGGCIANKCSAAPAILHELQECAAEITRLVTRLLTGWKDGLELKAYAKRTARLEVVDEEAKFDDWFPFWVTYRAIALEHGKDVNSFLVEFLGDMYKPGMGKNAHALRQTEWTSEEYYVREAEPLMQSMDDRAKRARTKIGQRPVGSRMEDARRARPSTGPLGYPAYVSVLPHLQALCADEADHADHAGHGADAEAARAALRTAHPSHAVEDLVEQHRFETSLKDVCRRVTDTYVRFIDETCPIFGSPPDFDLCNGLFALTALNMNLQPYAEQVNRKETWLLRLLHRFISLLVTELKDHNYRDISQLKKVVCQKRHSTQMDGDTLMRERRGHMIATVEALMVKELFVYINIRWSAFVRSPNGVPARFQPPEGADPAKRRSFLQKACNVWKNDPDSFKDAAMQRSDELRNKKLEVLLLEQADTTQDDRTPDLAVLVICMIGVNATVQRYPQLLQHHRDLCLLVTPEVSGPLKTPAERMDYFRKPRAYIANVHKATVEMKWLSVSERVNLQELRGRLVELKRELQRAIDLFEDGVRQTFQLRKHYDAAYSALLEKQAALLQRDEDTLDEDELAIVCDSSLLICDRAYSEALNMEKSETVRSHLQALCVQNDGVWRWTPCPASSAMEERHVHKKRLDSWAKTITNYIKLLDHVSELPCSPSQTKRTSFFNFMTSEFEYVQRICELKTVLVNGEPIPVDFGANLKKLGEDRFSTVDRRLSSFFTQKNEIIIRMLRGIRGALFEALRWSNCFAKENAESVLVGLPRLPLGVSAVLKLLTVAEAFGRIHYTSDERTHADSVANSDEFAFFVCDATLFDDKRDLRCASLEQLNKLAQTDWNFVCALAVVAREVLSFNESTPFKAGDVLLDLHCPRNATIGNIDNGGFIFLPVREELQETLLRLTVGGAGRGECKSISEALQNYPFGFDFLFSDDEFLDPNKLLTLFEWCPLLAHRTTGFYTLPKQSLSPDEMVGLLKHCAKDVKFPEEELNFAGFLHVVDKLGVEHTMSHADGGESPSFAIPCLAPLEAELLDRTAC